MKRDKVWVYLAVNKPGLRSGDTRLWRCFVGDSKESIPLHDCIIVGTANQNNWNTRGQLTPDDRDLIGWVQMFGDIEIAEDILTIRLRTST